MSELKRISGHGAFGGKVEFYEHTSAANKCQMRFAVFSPPGKGPFPVLTYLAGLTCTEETFMTKGCALGRAAELGLMLVAPDTSPRGEGVPDDPEQGWDFGLGAGFYLNATEEPWSSHYNMERYLTEDLQNTLFANFPGDKSRQGIFGHSMGGHGALTLGLRHQDIYQSISAFAPISAPCECPWGKKAFSNYLGDDRELWKAHDASQLMAAERDGDARNPILVDQGLADQFLNEQLHPHLLEQAAEKSRTPLTLRRHEGYDHGYNFIATFMADHLDHHAGILS